MSSNNNPNTDKSSDFVTPAVSKALNQARQLFTKGKTEDKSKDNVIEESTTLKVSSFEYYHVKFDIIIHIIIVYSKRRT